MIQLKDDYQIEMIRKSCKLLAQMFEEVGPQIVDGISTWDIDRLCETFMKKHHASGPCKGYCGYPNVSCTSVNDVVIHGIPNKHQILKDGDIISLDVCIDLDGYISDSTHTYEIGKVSDDVHKLNKETERMLYLGIEAAGREYKILVLLSPSMLDFSTMVLLEIIVVMEWVLRFMRILLSQTMFLSLARIQG